MLQYKEALRSLEVSRIIRGIISCFQPRFKILAYHSVNSTSRDPYEVNARNFFMQMQYLSKEGYNVVPLSQAVGMLLNKKITGKTVVITFDDGFNCLAEFAFPILKDLRFTATVFLPFKYIGNIDSFSYEYTRTEMHVLGWKAIEESLENGITYGSHTMTHRSLTKLHDIEIAAEVAESKEILNRRIGNKIVALAYPFGMFNERVKSIVRDTGYDCALCFGNILSNTKKTDLFELKREKVLNTTELDVFSKIIDVRCDFPRKLRSLF